MAQIVIARNSQLHIFLVLFGLESGELSFFLELGLGALSFAFECQESAFLVRESLEKPAVSRWAKVTFMTLTACLFLFMACAIAGHLGCGPRTKGNILDNLDPNSTASFVAHGMIEVIMFATYPLASFVSRHVFVVLLFEGQQAHEGGADSLILKRADRQILFTLFLCIVVLVPASLSSNVGSVLAVDGVIGGSSLAYIGPGMLCLAVHGWRFLKLTEDLYFVSIDSSGSSGLVSESTSLIQTAMHATRRIDGVFKTLLWYLGGFPIRSRIAETGKQAVVVAHVEKVAADNKLEPLRIGDVNHAPVEKLVANSNAEQTQKQAKPTSVKGAPSVSLTHLIKPRSPDPDSSDAEFQKMKQKKSSHSASFGTKEAKTSLCAFLDAKEGPDTSPTIQPVPALEADPQEVPPEWLDFFIAIFYICFGVLALMTGLLSLDS